MIDYSHNKIGMQYFKYDVIEQSGRKKVLAQLEYNVYKTELKIEQIWAEESIDKFRKIEITDCFTNNCIPLLIREHLINNSDMVFDLILQPHN